MNIKRIITTAAVLSIFSLISAGLVSTTFEVTEERIAAEEQLVLLQKLNTMIPEDEYNNDLAGDIIQSNDALLGPGQHAIYRARLKNKPVAAVLSATSPDGYSGKIGLLIGIYTNGKIAGVRVNKHKETPGLGDKIEIRKSDWIKQFTGKSLTNPSLSGWQVKKLGGEFDQLTGATISPSAIIKATRHTLSYFKQQQHSIFAELP